jgi:drug/metabolite transporter (DMT)-like permease
MNKQSLVNWLIFILLSLIWGSSFILMKISTAGLNAAQIASVRIFSAGLVFLPFAIFHLKKIPADKLLMVILTGVFGNLLTAFLFAAAIANNIDSSLAAILNSLTPLSVVILGAIFFNAKIRSDKITGILIGFAGLCLLTITQKNINLQNAGYAALVLLATISYGLNVNIISYKLNNVNPFQAATVSLAFMCIPSGIVLWQQHFFNLPLHEPVIYKSVLASVTLGIAGSAIATAFFYVLVKRAGGLFASMVTYGIPFIAIAWGLVFNEEVTLLQAGCLAIILCGVYITNKK